MQKGIIPGILNFSVHDEYLQGALNKALEEFFGIPPEDKRGPLQIPEEFLAHFNEWFVFDYKLPNGRTVLQYFYDQNPLNLAGERYELYKQLQSGEYSLWEVVDVRFGEGLRLRNIQNNIERQVQEFKATLDLKVGTLFFSRIVRLGDHWEMVSADAFLLDEDIEGLARQSFMGRAIVFTPKEMVRWFTAAAIGQLKPQAIVSLEEARGRMDSTLVAARLNQVVSTAIIQNWIELLPKKGKPSDLQRLLLGLLDEDTTEEGKHELMSAFVDLYNLMPRPALAGKSRFQLNQENPYKVTDGSEFNVAWGVDWDEWFEKQKSMSEYMKQEQYEAAIATAHELFSELLRYHATAREIYRLYANVAVCYLCQGDKVRGKRVLDYALRLNPNYDFVQIVKARLETGGYDDVMLLGHLQQVAMRMELHRSRSRGIWRPTILQTDYPAKYFKFIQKFNINFSTPELTHSVLNAYDGKTTKKIGRNDPCPCNSGKKYKRCHG